MYKIIFTWIFQCWTEIFLFEKIIIFTQLL